MIFIKPEPIATTFVKSFKTDIVQSRILFAIVQNLISLSIFWIVIDIQENSVSKREEVKDLEQDEESEEDKEEQEERNEDQKEKTDDEDEKAEEEDEDESVKK